MEGYINTCMEIAMCRGDAETISFTINDVDDGEPIQFVPDNIYFTVKKYADDHDPVIQKTLESGSIQYEGDGVYRFDISPSDTNDLKIGKYAFDIEIVADALNIHKTFLGTMTIEREVTHSYNEGV